MKSVGKRKSHLENSRHRQDEPTRAFHRVAAATSLVFIAYTAAAMSQGPVFCRVHPTTFLRTLREMIFLVEVQQLGMPAGVSEEEEREKDP